MPGLDRALCRHGFRFLVAALLATAAPAGAAVITVTSLANTGSGSLRDALETANTNAEDDVIDLTGLAGTITLAGQLSIEADGGHLLEIEGPGAAVLTLSGNGSVRVFEVAPGAESIISGVTIAGGSGGQGGGILNSGTLTISNSTLSGNSAALVGGGIYNEATLTISDSTLSGNSATLEGGGIDNHGPLTISGSTLSDNSTDVRGGGIHNEATLTISDSALSENSAGIEGGGILNEEATLTVSDTTLSGNSAELSGGAISNLSGGMVTISDSTLSGNSADFIAGGGISNAGALTISNTTLWGNSADFSGGGISNQSVGTATISTSTLTGNSSRVIPGGGIENYGALTIESSIVANSTSGGDCSGTLTAQGVNFATDGSCAGFTQVTSLALDLQPLAVSAPGTTATHALGPASVAIDAAADCNDVDDAPVPTDQRGASRPFGGGCDVGAFELNPGTLTVTVDPVAAPEGDAGSHDVTFTVHRAGGSDGAVSVELDASTSTATLTSDFTSPLAPIVVGFAAGETEKTVVLAVLGDTVVEPDETIELALANVTGGAALGVPASAAHTIEDDDAGVFGSTLAAEKTVAAERFVTGALVTYTIVVTNLGPGDRADLPGDELVDPLPAGLVLLGASADSGSVVPDLGTNTVTWNGALQALGSATILVEAEIAADVPPGTVIANQATVVFDADNDGALDAQSPSDDPAVAGAADATRFTVGARAVTEIPTLGTGGFALVALLLAAAGLWAIRRTASRPDEVR